MVPSQSLQYGESSEARLDKIRQTIPIDGCREKPGAGEDGDSGIGTASISTEIA